MKMKTLFLRTFTLVATLFLTGMAAKSADPQLLTKYTSAPTAGQDYYLMNVYQGKFLSYGNAYGTQVSLVPFADSRALRCTVTDAGGG